MDIICVMQCAYAYVLIIQIQTWFIWMGSQAVRFPFVSIGCDIIAVIQFSKIIHLLILRNPLLYELYKVQHRMSVLASNPFPLSQAL